MENCPRALFCKGWNHCHIKWLTSQLENCHQLA